MCRDRLGPGQWGYMGDHWLRIRDLGFPGGAVVKNLFANAGDKGSSPGPGRSHMPWSN